MEISEIPFHGHDGLWANLAEEDGDVFAVLSYQLTMSAKKAFRREHQRAICILLIIMACVLQFNDGTCIDISV